jgi:hypothetical protein
VRRLSTRPHLKTATLLVSIPNSHVVLSTLPEAPTIIKVSGNKGTRIVFSCTWKEKRKKDIDEVSIEKSRRGERGPGPVVGVSFRSSIFVDGVVSAALKLSFPVETPGLVGWATTSSFIRELNPVLNNPTTEGKNPTAVRSVESFTKVPGLARLRHLRTTLEKHQKFATLSSKSPRENGNILVTGSRIAVGEANGGRNGRNRRMNDATVTTPS